MPRAINPDVHTVPATWSVPTARPASGATAFAGWWSRFRDPLLERLVADALHTNTSVIGAEAALREARALRNVAAATLFPVLGGSASVQRSSSDLTTTGRRTINNFQAGLDASWELDLFGGNRSALKASEATAHASEANLGDVQVSIAAEVALVYITLRNAQARLAIASSNLESQQQTLQITSWRQQAGLVTDLEVEQARAATEQTSALLPALQTTIAQAANGLAVLVGQPPSALKTLLAVAVPVPQPEREIALSLPAEALRQRPDVRFAEYSLVAAEARVSEAEAARWPSLSIGGSLGLSALTLGALTSGASVVDSLLASVSLPILDGGARRATVDARQAALEQAQSAYRGAVLLALQEVEDALVARQDDRLRLVRLGRAADAATNAALMARQRYASGLVDFQTVLETQRTRLGTQDSVANARADVSTDDVRLYKALGGGWEASASNGGTVPP